MNKKIGKALIINDDCMNVMRDYPDNYFDLVIVDPPYGNPHSINKIKRCITTRIGGQWASKYDTQMQSWDQSPPQEYFDELFRVSKQQIIWGGNNFPLPPSRNFVIWNKYLPESFSMAMCEYAWCSMSGNAKIIAASPQGNKTNPRFHPTQKPVKLYEFVLRNYAKEGMKILDTHMGSGSLEVACNRFGYEVVACEIDNFYFSKSAKRIRKEYNEQRALLFK